jgi:hypothetical protein
MDAQFTFPKSVYETLSDNSYNFIGFAAGVHSGSAVRLVLLRAEAFLVRSYWLLTQCGALAIGTIHFHAEGRRSLLSTPKPVAN